MGERCSAFGCGLAAIDYERQVLQASAAGRRDGKAPRIRRLLGSMPELADRCRRLLVDGCIWLAPNAAGTAAGLLRLQQVLELAGRGALRLSVSGTLVFVFTVSSSGPVVKHVISRVPSIPGTLRVR